MTRSSRARLVFITNVDQARIKKEVYIDLLEDGGSLTSYIHETKKKELYRENSFPLDVNNMEFETTCNKKKCRFKVQAISCRNLR